MKFILVVLALVSLSAAQPRPALRPEVVASVKGGFANLKKIESVITEVAKYLKDNKGKDVLANVLDQFDVDAAEAMFLIAVKMANHKPVTVIADMFRKFRHMVKVNKAVGYTEEEIYSYTTGSVFAHLLTALSNIINKADPTIAAEKGINVVKLEDFTPTKAPTKEQKSLFNFAVRKIVLYGNDQNKFPFNFGIVAVDKDVNPTIKNGVSNFFEKLSSAFDDPDLTTQLNDAFNTIKDTGSDLMVIFNTELKSPYASTISAIINAFREGILAAHNDLYRKTKTIGQTPPGENAPAVNPQPPQA